MAFLGLGTVWAQGLSGSAALQVASAKQQPRAGAGRHPRGWSYRTAEDIGIELRPLIGRGSLYNGSRGSDGNGGKGNGNPVDGQARRPGDWLEHSPLFSLLVVLLGAVYLVRYFDGKKLLQHPRPLNARDIMRYTFTMFRACFPAALITVTLLAPHVTG
ncbi:MAG TPA: hypothetical protein VGD71_04110 [Kribbella sp.]|jgi:short-chain fatty acids transporter